MVEDSSVSVLCTGPSHARRRYQWMFMSTLTKKNGQMECFLSRRLSKMCRIDTWVTKPNRGAQSHSLGSATLLPPHVSRSS